MGLTLALVAGMQVARAEGGSITVKGYVLDSACAFTKNLSKPISADCAVACAKAGSPLVILADDGTIYWPISDASSLPAKGQNDRVMKFAGQQVSVQGTVYAKGGSHAIVIQKIEAAAAK
jgi:type 1 fimbria pilin